MVVARSAPEPRQLTEEELARIAYLKDSRYKYGYMYIAVRTQYYKARAHSIFSFSYKIDGIKWNTPFLASPEEAVLFYEDNPGYYPRVVLVEAVLPKEIPSHIDLEDMRHMFSKKNEHGFVGVLYDKRLGTFKGRYAIGKKQIYVGGAKNTALEAAWEVRNYYPREAPKIVDSSEPPLPPVDFEAIQIYRDTRGSHGYRNINQHSTLKTYRGAWQSFGIEYYTPYYKTPEEAVWAFHLRTKDIVLKAPSSTTMSPAKLLKKEYEEQLEVLRPIFAATSGALKNVPRK